MNRKIPLTLRYFLTWILIIIFTTHLSSQDKNESQSPNLIMISSFYPYKSNRSEDIQNKVEARINSSFVQAGFSTKQSQGGNLSERLDSAKKANSSLLVEGYYQKVSAKNNLNLYIQIYNPSTGKIIDAYYLSDETFEGKGLQIDPNDLLEDDEIRIEKFTKKLTQMVRTNKGRKENQESITKYLSESKISMEIPKSSISQEAGTDDKSSQVFDLLMNQETKASTKYSKKASEAPNVVSVIQNKELVTHGRVTLNDVMYNLPGFSVSQTNERRTVSSRGIPEGYNNNHLLLLIDGVQFNDSFYGTALTNEVTPLNIVKSMEVIRGPGSSLYGSNATNGVISLNTYSGEDFNGDFQGRIRVGGNGTKIYDLITGNKGQLFSYLVSYTSYETNGLNRKDYDNSERKDAFGYLRKFEYNDKRDNYSLFTKLEGQGSLAGLSLQMQRNKWAYQTFNGWLFNNSEYEEFQKEGMDSAVIKYNKDIGSKLSQEYVVKVAENSWDYNVRYYPNNTDYPSGLWENLKTKIPTIFGRAQLNYKMDNGGNIIGGMEASRLKYSGDIIHNSNVDLGLLGEGLPYENGILEKQNPAFEWVKNKPIDKIASFLQYSSGRILEKYLELTLGVRYDETVAKYRGIDMPYKNYIGYPPTIDITQQGEQILDEQGNAVLDENGNNVLSDPITTSYKIPNQYLGPPYITNEKKIYRRTSPRAGLVIFPTSNLTLKLMTGSAYREPSFGELYGVNTYVGGSNNPRILAPEIIRTNEVALDYFFSRYLNFRANGFQTKFDNIIGFTGANEIRNLNNLGSRGGEVEILFFYKKMSGFANYSRFYRYSDSSRDPTIYTHPKEVTKTPSSAANFGISFDFSKIVIGTNVRYQGRVVRRRSDLGTVDRITGQLEDNKFSDPYSYPQYRPVAIEPWTNVNFRIMYKFTESTQLGFYITNALNKTQRLIEYESVAFDYYRDSRRFMIDFMTRF
jgi:outer membrane cobalamin receptor